jgi:acyl-[acyl-carrier-protein]-phospholipid O-acyltransferase/long-chain-fatty-acid--[acyl-carrier-protein] ligase
VTQKRGATRTDFQAFAKEKGAADLMVPSEVLIIDNVPVLGSGKVDHVSVVKLVRELVEARAAEAALQTA